MRCGARPDLLEGRPVLRRLPLAAQRQIDLGGDLGERGAQLVRDLGGQAPLAPDARGQPVQQAVERRREAGDLVVRGADVEAVVQVPLAPVLRVLGHARDGAQRGAQHQGGGDGDGAQHDQRERRGRDHRDHARAVVGRERESGDHGPHPPSVVDDRQGVEVGVVAGVDRPLRPRRERARRRVGLRVDRGRAQGPRAVEDPDLGGDSGARDLRREGDAGLGDAQAGQLAGRPGAHDLVGVVGEAPRQRHVEGDDEQDERHAHAGDDGQQQPRPQGARPARAHRITYPTPCTVSRAGASGSARSLRRSRAM